MKKQGSAADLLDGGRLSPNLTTTWDANALPKRRKR